MTRDDWLDRFVDELVKLRPHLEGSKMARTLALQQYKAGEHPRDMVRQYDKEQRPQTGEAPKKVARKGNPMAGRCSWCRMVGRCEP